MKSSEDAGFCPSFVMTANAHLRTVSPANLLLKLHHDQTTGVRTVKDGRSTIRIYLQGGHMVYADGIDKEAELLRKIEAKRPLDPERFPSVFRLASMCAFSKNLLHPDFP